MGNLNTNFTPIQGKPGTHWIVKQLPMIASVAMEAGSAIYRVGDGTHTVVTTSSGNFAGILLQPIAATDSDYATSLKLKSVMVPLTNEAQAEFTVGSGTFTTADVGKNADFADAVSVAVDTSTHDQVTITKYLTSTRGVCSFNPNIE